MMIRRLFAVPALLALMACVAVSAPKDKDMIASSYDAADHMMETLTKAHAVQGTVLYTSFVDINDVETSSRFGQMLAEQFSSRFAQGKFQVAEARLRDNFAINKDGEFMLSRNTRVLAQQQAASAVIVGTYAAGQNDVLVSARVIDLATGTVLASNDYSIPKGPNVSRLLGEKSAPHWETR